MTAEEVLVVLDEVATSMSAAAARNVRRAIEIARTITPELREAEGDGLAALCRDALARIPTEILADELARRGLEAGG